MKCPKCSYVSHDYLDACRKCSINLVEFKRKFNLMVLQPGELDLGVLVDIGEEGLTDRDRFSSEDATLDTPHGESHRTNGLARKISMAKSPRVEAELDKMPADVEVDIQFDTDNTTMTTEPGALTRMFYVPEELAKQTFNMPLPDRKAALDERPPELKGDSQPETDHPALLAENMPDLSQTTPAASTIDMSLEELENGFDNMPAAPQVDRQLNIDNPTPSTEPGEFTKMFYVGVDEIPAAPQVDSQLDPGNPAPLANAESSAQSAQYSPANTLEISVGELDGGFDEFEDIQLDTTEIDQDIDLAFNLPSSAESKSAEPLWKQLM